MVLGYGLFEVLSLLGVLFGMTYAKIYVDKQEEEAEKEQNAIFEKYQNALEEFYRDQDNTKLHAKVLKLGEQFYEFNYPDNYTYPLPDFGYASDFIDNAPLRKELVSRDIKDYIKTKSIHKAA